MPFEEKSSTITTAKASGNPDFWGRGESEVAMKKLLCVGLLLALALLFAQTASADPCGLCQSYYPCSWGCENCVAGRDGPGLWFEDGSCWGDIVEATCGDSGQCSGQPSDSNWSYAPVDQGVNSEQGAQSLPALMPTDPPTH